MAKLPAIVKTRAAGGSNVAASPAMTQIATAALTSPEDTFGVLRDLLIAPDGTVAALMVEQEGVLREVEPAGARMEYVSAA